MSVRSAHIAVAAVMILGASCAGDRSSFMFEGAASLFVWDTSKRAFVRVWMSD
jgi:hypothetical protein